MIVSNLQVSIELEVKLNGPMQQYEVDAKYKTASGEEIVSGYRVSRYEADRWGISEAKAKATTALIQDLIKLGYL